MRTAVLGRRAGAGLLSCVLLGLAVVSTGGPDEARAQGPGRGPIPVTTRDVGGGLTLISSGSNAVLAVGRDGAILVDTTFGGPAFVARVRELTPTVPVRYVINTHGHPDHVGANADFGRAGATVVSTLAASLIRERDFPRPTGNGVDPAVPPEGRPRQTFTESGVVAVQGQRADLVGFTRAHSGGDLFVHFRDANVIVMGDLHHSNEYPVYDADTGCRCGSYEGNLQAYDAMLAAGNDRTIYIPGHGGPTTRAEVTAYVAMLRRIRERLMGEIAAGRTVDEVVALKLLADDRSPTTPGPDNRDPFIRTLYTALKTGQGR